MTGDGQAIRIRSLEKTFRSGVFRRRSPALNGLDLDVAAGEVFGFLGPNGAGKTTAIKILVGLLKADAGQALVFGRPAGDVGTRRRIAYLPELPDFYDYLKPGEFLAHCGRLSGLDRMTIRQRVPELLERVGLEPDERRPLRKFSKGMLQRTGIAQAMLADPDLYILDEPMGGLDPIGRRWIKNLILDLARQGKTVFFSSHVLAEAEAVCDRVAFLHQGRLVAQGATTGFLDRHAGNWEILVSGEKVRDDEAIAKIVAGVEPSGPDSLLTLAEDRAPESVLPALAERGYRLRTVQRRHASLEDAFIRMVTEREEA